MRDKMHLNLMRNIAVCCLIGFTFAVAAPVVWGAESCRLPMSRTPCPIVAVTINGKKMKLIMDTGSHQTILNISAFEKMRREQGSRGASSRDKINIRSLKIGSITLNNVGYLHRNQRGKPYEEADGILGTDVLGRLAIGFDFRNERIVLWKNGRLQSKEVQTFYARTRNPKAPGRLAPTMVPLVQHQAEEIKDVRMYFVDVTVGQVKTSMFLDTGSSTSVASVRLKNCINAYPTEYSIDTFLMTGKATATAFGVKDLALKDIKIEHSIIADFALPYETLPIDILGMNILARFHVILDLPAQKMYLSPRPEMNSHSPLWRWGLVPAHTPLDRSHFVLKDSPAWRAGLRALVRVHSHASAEQGSKLALKVSDPRPKAPVKSYFLTEDKTWEDQFTISRGATFLPPFDGARYHLAAGGSYHSKIPEEALKPGETIVKPPNGGYLIGTSIRPVLASEQIKIAPRFYTLQKTGPLSIPTGGYWEERVEAEGFLIFDPEEKKE
jgi:predicted aspartyl protease